jgi:hypothetical protein
MKLLSIIMSVFFLIGCSSSETVERIDAEAIQVEIKDLIDTPDKYAGKLVKFSGYLIGSEYSQYDEAEIFVICLADESLSGELSERIIFPDIKYKLRIAEDGYNDSVLKQCYTLSQKAGKLGLPIGIVGVYAPGRPYFYYQTGIDVYLQELHVDSRMLNTDYDDKTKFSHEAPGTFKKVYKGGKKVFEVIKDLIP